jgi:hypothetical protein
VVTCHPTPLLRPGIGTDIFLEYWRVGFRMRMLKPSTDCMQPVLSEQCFDSFLFCPAMNLSLYLLCPVIAVNKTNLVNTLFSVSFLHIA